MTIPEHRTSTADAATQEAKHIAFTRQYYLRHRLFDHGLVQGAHSDAAHMCDALAADIRREHTRRGRVTKEGEALAAAVKRAGDAIWKMRSEICPD